MSRVSVVFLTSLLLLPILAQSQETTVTSYLDKAIADGTIRNGETVTTDSNTVFANLNASHDDRWVVEFPIREIPQGSRILYAELSVNNRSSGGAGTGDFEVYGFAGDGAVSAPDYFRTENPVANFQYTVGDFGLYDFNVREQIQALADQGESFAGFMGRALTNDVLFSFGAVEASNTSGAELTMLYVPPGTSCDPDSFSPYAACLRSGRFLVAAIHRYSFGLDRFAAASQLDLGLDSAYFTFFSPFNVELVVKVLDSCASRGTYFFFAAGLTNQGVEIFVHDLQADEVREYERPFGPAFEPILDTRAFETCP